MRLFSEKVNPTFNSSGYNILTVKDYTEVFFDVYEFEINGSRFVAEKTGVFEDSPIVSIPVDHNNIVEQYDFVLHKGSQSIHFDPSTTSTPSHIKSTSDVEPLLVESVEEETDEVFLEDKKVAILEEIEKAKVAAAKYISQIEKQNKRELVNYQTEREVALKEDIDKQKKILLDEFYTLVEELRDRIAEESIDATLELKDLISDKLKKVSSNVDAQIASAERAIDTKIEERANELLNNVLLSEVKRSSKDIADNLNSQVKTIAENISKSLTSTKKQIEVDINEKLQEISTELNAKDKAIVELNDNVNKQSNRALSRIGTVKTQLEGTVKDVVNSLEARIDSASAKLTNYYSEKLQLVEASLSDASEHTKNHIIGLIKESHQSLQNDIANIKVTVPNIVIEKSNGKQEIDVAALRTELEKSVSGRFVNEISSLKRLIELSSGGGSVAMQFAAGGTMNGNLTVVGAISASQYLGITIPSGDYLPLSGGTVSGNVTVTGGLSADRIYTTQLDALSANITVIDIKQYELSGFNVTGNVTINGSVSAQNISAVNLYSTNRVGIGTTTPAAPLHINTSQSGVAVRIGQDGTVGRLEFGNVNVALTRISNQLALQGFDGFTFGTSSGERMRIDSSGNVGIGTTTPNEKLHIYDSVDAHLKIAGADTAGSIRKLSLERSTGGGEIHFNEDTRTTQGLTLNTTNAAYPMSFQINGDTKMFVSTAGSVGIGTTTPTAGYALDVVGAAKISGNILCGGSILYLNSQQSLTQGTNSLTLGAATYFTTINYGNASTTIHNFAAGNVGIGTATPNEKLQVTNGNIGTFGNGNGFVMYNLGQGNYSGNYEMARFMPVSNEFLFQTLQGGTGVGRNLRFAIGNANLTFVNSSGNIGIGTTSPSAKLHTISTTEQVRFGYDTNNYWNATTNSVGITTLSAVGSGAKFVISSNVDLENRLSIIKQGIDFDYVTKPIAPTLALAGLAGNVPVGTNYYYITYVTADGETEFGNSANITVASAANAQVNVTLPVSSDPKVIARKIYRGTSTAVAGFLATVSDNTTTLYVDNTATVTSILQYRTRFVGNTTAGNIFADGTKNIEIDSTGALKLANPYNSFRMSKREVATGTTVPQVVLYNTTDEENNVEYGGLSWANNVFEVGTFGRGTGALRKLRLKSSNLSVALNFDLERGGTDWASIIDSGTSISNTSFVRYNPTTWSASGGENRLLTLGTVALNNTGSGGYSLFNIDATGGTGGTGSKFFTRYTLGGSPIHTIDYQGNGYFAGNAGIGTTTPNEKLTVVGNISATGNIQTSNGIVMTGVPTNVNDINYIQGTNSNTTVGFLAGSGTFNANSGPYFAARGNTYTALAGQRGAMFFSAGNVSSPTGLEGVITFSTGANNIRMVINRDGNVGIGTTTPNEKLTVVGNISATGNLNIGGGLVTPITTVNTNTTLLSSNYVILADASSSSVRIQLPAASLHTGRTYHIKKIDSTTNLVTLSGNIAETIDGLNTQAINAQYISLTIVSNGTNWFII